jgi:hypothetical protein
MKIETPVSRQLETRPIGGAALLLDITQWSWMKEIQIQLLKSLAQTTENVNGHSLMPLHPAEFSIRWNIETS